jgi:hypothetical protein
MKQTLTILPVLLAVLGCGSSIDISHDFDQAANFDGYRTFQWMTPDHQANSLMGGRIEDAVTSQLEAKGLQSVSDNPDLLATYHAGKEGKVEVDSYGYSYAPGYRRGAYRGGYGGGIDTYNYTQGTLIIDIIDAAKQELVWRGTATGVMDENPDPNKIEKKVNEVVAKILKDYPPQR